MYILFWRPETTSGIPDVTLQKFRLGRVRITVIASIILILYMNIVSIIFVTLSAKSQNKLRNETGRFLRVNDLDYDYQ